MSHKQVVVFASPSDPTPLTRVSPLIYLHYGIALADMLQFQGSRTSDPAYSAARFVDFAREIYGVGLYGVGLYNLDYNLPLPALTEQLEKQYPEGVYYVNVDTGEAVLKEYGEATMLHLRVSVH
jgi:hypothetical protein